MPRRSTQKQAMEDWGVDYINDYCNGHHRGCMECKVSEEKGRILLSSASFEEGDLIFQEPPLHIVAEDSGNQAFACLKELCTSHANDFDYEPLWYWTALNSLTKEDLALGGPNRGTLKVITPDQQKRLLLLYHAEVTSSSAATKKIIAKLGLGVDEIKLERLLQIWILNCFEHSDSPLGYSTYFMSSFMSHSCFPNAVWHYMNEDTFALRARQRIRPGDEISISYLSEDALLESAHSRQKHLEDSKHFKCCCERCMPQPSEKLDKCRGFKCPHCGKPGIFVRLGDHKGAEMLKDVECALCGKALPQREAEKLVKEEKWLTDRLDDWDKKLEQKGTHARYLTEAGVADVLKRVEASVGQHWLCDKLWSHLSDWHEAVKKFEEAQAMMERRVHFQRCAYPGLSGALAWTLESQADMMLRHAGFKDGDGRRRHRLDDKAKALVREAAPRALGVYEDSMRILRLMFGEQHEYYTSVADKHKEVKTHAL